MTDSSALASVASKARSDLPQVIVALQRSGAICPPNTEICVHKNRKKRAENMENIGGFIKVFHISPIGVTFSPYQLLRGQGKNRKLNRQGGGFERKSVGQLLGFRCSFVAPRANNSR